MMPQTNGYHSASGVLPNTHVGKSQTTGSMQVRPNSANKRSSSSGKSKRQSTSSSQKQGYFDANANSQQQQMM